MENNNRFNLSFSKMFKSPFNSCKTQNQSSDVINNQNQTPIFTVVQQQQQNPQILRSPHEPFLSPRTIRPLMCKPRCPETFDEMVRENCIITKDSFTPRRKITERTSDDMMTVGRRCPPVSPISPLNNHFFKLQNQCRTSNGGGFEKQRRKTTTTKKKKKEKCAKAQLGGGKQNIKKDPFPQYRLSSYSYEEKEDWFSSDDEREDETETLFSSKSVSFNSLSSKSLSFSTDDESNRRQVVVRNRQKKKSGNQRRRRRGGKRGSEMDVLPLQEKVKGSFAVVKSSSDPYNDFRISMVEMIIEKQIFGVKELQNLLHCFLSLNSAHHHSVIVQVFTDIWEALFSNGS